MQVFRRSGPVRKVVRTCASHRARAGSRHPAHARPCEEDEIVRRRSCILALIYALTTGAAVHAQQLDESLLEAFRFRNLGAFRTGAWITDGVYRSTDAGATWQHMRLADTHHIARILVHPTDPDIVFVAAMGTCTGRTRSAASSAPRTAGARGTGSCSWMTGPGVIDLVMASSRPDVLYAATYEKERLPWHFELGGPGRGVVELTREAR
jgi:hypothetical protein